MTKLKAGNRRRGMLSQEDYLAPPHIPTGQPPKDVLNVIWRKNDVFLDIGEYSIGSSVMMIWPMFLIMYFFVGSLREKKNRVRSCLLPLRADFSSTEITDSFSLQEEPRNGQSIGSECLILKKQ